MTGPDRDAIRAALILGIHAVEAANYADDFVVDAEMDSVVATVAALMEDYAADLRAEVERLREDRDRFVRTLAATEKVLDRTQAERDNARGVIAVEAELSNPNSPAFIPTAYVRFLMDERNTATADRDAYAAERVRAALLDAAEAVEGYKPWSPLSSNESLLLTYAASMLRDRAGAS